MNSFRSHPVLVIVLAQLFGTSLWFSPNSAAPDLVRAWQLSTTDLGYLTSSVQIGFILGTLILATSVLQIDFLQVEYLPFPAFSERYLMEYLH